MRAEPYLGRGTTVILGRVGKRDVPEPPRAAGWYPDPWSATGEGERYFDGKKWGTNEKPFGRHTTAGIEPSRRAARSVAGRARNLAPFLAFVVLVAAVWGIPKLRGSHHGNAALPELSRPPTTVAPDTPPPSGEEAAQPLGAPAAVPPGPGKFEVAIDQPGDSAVPVAWDPCRPVHYVVNTAGAPPDGATLIQAAVARVQKATGLHFVNDGPTTEKTSKDRKPYQPARYDSTRWAPVLIGWSDETATPSLAGYIAGLGSPQAVYASRDRLVYVTGQVTLDRQQLAPARAPDRGVVKAIILHELGHLVGLNHTADRRQVMYSEAQFNVRDYGPGDLRGLARLGTQACFPGV
ncbi:MAG: hypothetical protein QOF59_3140 [Actinomycetota bacterium]|nr:hypothetical protein [Actinomycetota bacterium]